MLRIPIVEQYKTYKKEYLSGDLSAGLTVGVMLIPQGMAYSMLAGLPPIYGLYASSIPLIIYAILGTSRQLAVGPVAMVALLIASGVGSLAAAGSPEYLGYAILLALMVGVIQTSMGVFKLGFLVNFLSHPVIAGFTSAAAIIIGISQLKHLLGIPLAGQKVHEKLWSAVQHIDEVNIYTFILGLASILVLIAVKKINKRIPGPLVVVILGILAVKIFSLDTLGVKIVKEVPAGFPSLSNPFEYAASFKSLIPMALTISFVGFMESIAVAKAIQKKHKTYQVDASQELTALGMSNVVGSFFSSFPVTGGFSRTAVNDQAGANTGFASIISALVVLFTLLFLTEYFYYLPQAVLAAIIMVAVYGLIDFHEAKYLWKYDRRDFILFMVTAVATLTLGIEEGIIIGVILSLGVTIYNVSNPHIAELGNIEGTKEYRNIVRFPNVLKREDILIFRIDSAIFFANIEGFTSKVRSAVKLNPHVKNVVLECSAVTDIDSTAMTALKDLGADLRQKGIQLNFSDVKGPVRDIFARYGLLYPDNKNQFFISTHEAVEILSGKNSVKQNDYVLQAEDSEGH
ncbi:MAG: solute carrier family 26 protein [Saprospiraceae bacterium]|nr:solute carrier family 26 protein [Saprospiraceae bacterium]